MSSIEIQTTLTIGGAYLLLLLLQLVSWPVTKKIFKDLPDEGWAISRMFGLLIVSIFVWEVAFFKLPVNTQTGVATGFLLLLLLGILITGKGGAGQLIPKKDSLKRIALEEYLFLVGFGGIALVRSFLPHIDSLEKFMDYGFIVSYLHSPTLPAPDMWQAGSSINYYSFGHFWASVLIRFLGVESSTGYNLTLGFIAGVSLSMSFLLCSALGKEKKEDSSFLGSLMGALIVVFGGNAHTAWYWLKNHSLKSYWYADATRFIHNTIHEFPGYSLVVSDLHGHLFDLPVALFFMISLYLLNKRDEFKYVLVLGGVMAVMMMTNTWDIPIYGLLLSVFFLGKVVADIKKLGDYFLKGVTILAMTMLLSLPWWLSFVPISSGVAVVTSRSPLWQLVALWGILAIVNIATWFVIKRNESKWLIRSMIITSFVLILIPEFIYAKDIYPDHPRANTMFKLTYQAFIMGGVVFGVLLEKVIANTKEKFWSYKLLLTIGVLLLFGAVMVYPTIAFPAFYDNFKNIYGLDGKTWLKNKDEDKYEAINFLSKNWNGKNMVEAVGDSYTEKNVVSAYSGTPTIQGWRVHEWLWRGGYEPVAIREQQVRELYEGESIEKTRSIIDFYKVGWILVTADEGDMYLINHPKLRSFGDIVWQKSDSYLIKLRDN